MYPLKTKNLWRILKYSQNDINEMSNIKDISGIKIYIRCNRAFPESDEVYSDVYAGGNRIIPSVSDNHLCDAVQNENCWVYLLRNTAAKPTLWE